MKPVATYTEGRAKVRLWFTNELRSSNLGNWVKTGIYEKTYPGGKKYTGSYGVDIGTTNAPSSADKEARALFKQSIANLELDELMKTLDD